MTGPVATRERPLWAQGLLVAFIAFAYWDGLWGFPRADQLAYLYEASRFTTFPELLAHAPGWNRSVSIGDHLLYRPLLYLFLATEYRVFGLNFFLWQAAGIALHILETVLLYRLLLMRAGWPSTGALAVSALFSCLLLPAEAVIWQHVNGYILFACWTTASLSCLLDFLDTGGRLRATLSVVFAAAAAFTYELGVVYCGFAAAALLALARRKAPAPVTPPAETTSPRIGILAAWFTTIAIVYVSVSFGDLLLRFGHFGNSAARLVDRTSFALALRFALRQILIWTEAMLLPSTLYIGWGSRAFLGFRPAQAPLIMAATLVVAWLFVIGGVAAGIRARRDSEWRGLRGLALGLAFLYAYSFLIAVGRSVPRGLAYTLRFNLYYSYLAAVIIVAALALAGWEGRHASWARDNIRSERNRWSLRGLQWALGIGLVGVLASNAAGTMSLLSDFRHLYAAPRRELLYHARNWHLANGRGAYFVVSDRCVGNEDLSWFGPYARHRAATFHLLDALYPETSANLNRDKASLPGHRVVELSCAEGALDPRDLAGSWRSDAGPVTVAAAPTGRVQVLDRRGVPSDVILDGHTIVASTLNLSGLVSHDARYIFWKDGTTWRR